MSRAPNNSLEPWEITPADNAGPLAGPSADPAGWAIGWGAGPSGMRENRAVSCPLPPGSFPPQPRDLR